MQRVIWLVPLTSGSSASGDFVTATAAGTKAVSLVLSLSVAQ